MKRKEFIFLLQRELRLHSFAVFCSTERSMAEGGDGVMAPGCVKCKMNFQTREQFMSHLLMQVLSEVVEKILGKG